MKVGDIVRFTQSAVISEQSPWKVGLLIEYCTWEKIATILYEGRVIRVYARDVQLHTRAYQ